MSGHETWLWINGGPRDGEVVCLPGDTPPSHLVFLITDMDMRQAPDGGRPALIVRRRRCPVHTEMEVRQRYGRPPLEGRWGVVDWDEGTEVTQ